MSDLETKAEGKEAKDLSPGGSDHQNGNDLNRVDSASAAGADDLAIYPKGTLDPVYEAKARVLNRAVRDPLVPSPASAS